MKQRDAADLSKAAAELAELSRKRKRPAADADGTSPKRRKHVPQKLQLASAEAGRREKLDVDDTVQLTGRAHRNVHSTCLLVRRSRRDQYYVVQ